MVKLEIPYIYWHGNRDRIMSIDFHPQTRQLVTGGSDSEYISSFSNDSTEFKGFIKLWELNLAAAGEKQDSILLNQKKETIQIGDQTHKFVKFIGSLERHQATVNAVKFSTHGLNLASASDDHQVIIWERRERYKCFGSDIKEIGWSPLKVMIGHSRDIIDLRWSFDNKFILTGSIDNTVILWNVEKGKAHQRIEGHSHYVQGVCIDPFFKYLISQSSDRTVRVWKTNKSKQKVSFYCYLVIKKQDLERKTAAKEDDNAMKPESIDGKLVTQSSNSIRLFLDENLLSSFFRRPDWSPDGSFCVFPAAQYQLIREEKSITCVLIYRKSDFSSPAFVLNTNNKAAICAKFCPVIFKKDANNEFSMFDLPYKIIFAVATIDSVLIYSTQSLRPIVIVGNIHYAILTDLAWMGDQCLAVSSSDGFCSFLVFENKELGQPLEKNDTMPEEVRAILFPEPTNPIKEEVENKEDSALNEVKARNKEQKVEFIQNEDGVKKKIIKPKMLKAFNQTD